jgi:transcriptional/translational regulatory protein YebC/TACO1
MGRSFENRKMSILKTAGQKSKLYSKYGLQLYVVAKSGVPDPELNPALRNLIEKAKREQVPAHVIEKALEKARGAGGEDYVAARYEGFGPGGCSIIVDCLTNNNNRTITDVRNCFTKTGSKLGPSGSVSHSFDHLAVLSFKGDNAEQVLEAFPKVELEVQEISFVPQATKNISPEDVPLFEKFINLLNDCEDVQEIYHNAIVPG